MKNNLLYEQESFGIRGAVYEVYKELGCGFLEGVYQEALELELKAQGIPFESQKEICISYKGTPLKQYYKADIVCYGKIILELKAVKELLGDHSAQLFNYLRATGMKLGLLINFSHYPGADIRRIAL